MKRHLPLTGGKPGPCLNVAGVRGVPSWGRNGVGGAPGGVSLIIGFCGGLPRPTARLLRSAMKIYQY